MYSVDPDEMSHHAAFHLGLHCLPMYTLSIFTWLVYKGLSRLGLGNIILPV